MISSVPPKVARKYLLRYQRVKTSTEINGFGNNLHRAMAVRV